MSRGPVRQHSWHNSRSLLVVAIVVWCLVAAMALVIGWFMPALIAHTTSSTIGDATYYDTEASGAAARFAAGLAIAVLPVGVIGILAQAFYGGADDGGAAWGVAYYFGLPIAGVGIGATVRHATDGRASALMIGLAILGLAICSLQWVTLLIRDRRRRIREQVRRTGIHTTARVMKVRVVNTNDVHSWKAWLQYSDTDGNIYHVTHLEKFFSSHTPKVGDEYSLSYDPASPGARSHVVVEGPRYVEAGASHRTRFVHWRGPAPQ